MMYFFRQIILIIFVLILSFILQSCTGMKNVMSSNDSAQKTSNSRTDSDVPSKSPTQVENSVQKHIKSGDYQKMVNVYNSEHRKQPRDLQLMQKYANSLNSAKSTADNALEKNDYAYASRIYYILRKNYGKFSHFNQLLSFNKAYLNDKLSYCKKNLSIQGFQEYRKGNIDTALASWQDALYIDPKNEEIKEAMAKAKQQKKNLQ